MTDISITTRLHVLSCANCGLQFAIDKNFEQRRREDHKGFYCPAGHSNVYDGETELEKERRYRQQLQQQNARLHEEALKAIKLRDRIRTKFNSHKRRTKAGLCPCCNRSFVNMQRHMKTKHPDYNVVPLKTG